MSEILLVKDTFGELNQYVRSIANKYKACTTFALVIAVVVLLSTVPIGSTIASTKSFSNNIKTETKNGEPSGFFKSTFTA